MIEEEHSESLGKTFLTYKTKVADAYSVDHLIGQGGYGQTYDIFDIKTNFHYAMKIEFNNSSEESLQYEAKILKHLNNSDRNMFFPKYIEYGKSQNYKYLIMELMGPSLSSMSKALGKNAFSKYSYLSLGYHMIKCIEALHKIGYIHRDVKPSNFLIRPNRRCPLVMIDFGLARKFINKDTGAHMEPRSDAGYTGTVRYASIHAHNKEELSRRDDLISWFYSMIELSQKQTPWPGNENKNEARRLKISFTKNQLCSHFPPEFKEIYDLIFNLGYMDEPDYTAIKDLLLSSINNLNCGKYQRYEWESFSKDKIFLISPISLDMEDPSSMSNDDSYSISTHSSKENKEKPKIVPYKEEEDGSHGCALCNIF